MDHAAIAVINYNYWTARFSRNPDVLGKTIYVKGVPITIVGVAAAGFEGVEPGHSTDFWIPLQNRAELNAWGTPPQDGKLYQQMPTWWCLRMLARLAPGVSREQAAARLQGIFRTATYVGIGNPMQGEKPPVLSFDQADSFPGSDATQPLSILMAMVGLVLVIALTNVVMLLMARNATRQREFSLRLALGARRGELLCQLLTESLLLVTVGGILAWAFAELATTTLGRWAHIDSSLAPDETVLLFTLGLLLFAALLFGLAPFRVAVAGGAEMVLKTSAATSGTDTGKTRVGKIVVAAQMALCVVLLVGAGLLVRTMRNLEHIPLGMRTEGLVVFGVNPQRTHSASEEIAFYQELLRRLRVLPGVEGATVMSNRVGSGWSSNNNAVVDGNQVEPTGSAASNMQRCNDVGPDFFHTLGVPIVMGREFNDADTAASQNVAVVSELFAQRFLPHQNPLGHHVGAMFKGEDMVIVGVVKDNKYTSMNEAPIPMVWYDYAQAPLVGAMHVEMRVHGDPLAILPLARKAIAQMDPDVPLTQPMLQRKQFERTISQELMFARLAEFFGLLAAMLVATGLYGTLSYRVNTRTAEIGVRMAVGARREQVMWMILKGSLLLTATGVMMGVPLAMLVGRGLTSSLYGVQPLDAASYLLAVVGVVVVALAASAVPAARAANVNPWPHSAQSENLAYGRKAFQEPIGWCSPKTLPMLPAISPTVALLSTASRIAGITLSEDRACSVTRSRAACQRRGSRRARSARTRSICSRSTVSAKLRAPGESSPGPVNRFTPTTTVSPESMACCWRYAASSISRCTQPRSMAAAIPPSASIRSRYSRAPCSIAVVSDST